jgi:hypothetical protein
VMSILPKVDIVSGPSSTTRASGGFGAVGEADFVDVAFYTIWIKRQLIGCGAALSYL